MDYLYVNILSKGYIPFIKKEGPVYGLKITKGIYYILLRRRELKIEVISEKEAAKINENKKVIVEESAEKEIEILKIDTELTDNTINAPQENISISQHVIENDEDDDEIDAILLNNNTPTSIGDNLKEILKPAANDRIYTNSELKEMTKAELRQILKDRGYTSGVYAPKYHDKLDKLRSKVQKTQEI